MRKFLIFIFLLIGVFAIVSCDRNSLEIINETDETLYRRAINEKGQGNEKEALNCFLKVIDKRRGNAPASHFEVAGIYLENINNPIRAIYHYEKYLEVCSDTPKSSFAKAQIEKAQKELAKRLPANPYQNQLEIVQLNEYVDSLKKENESLKQLIANLQAKNVDISKNLSSVKQANEALQNSSNSKITTNTNLANSSTIATNSSTGRMLPKANVKTYIVKSGDTLSSISRAVYGSPERWKTIYEHNKNVLSAPNALKPGQELTIP